jgi:hypothetical protein
MRAQNPKANANLLVAVMKSQINRRHLANEIVGSAKEKTYSVSEFIHALVRSEAFQKK